MYSKKLRQFSKGSLISTSSESSKIDLFIKVLYGPIWTLLLVPCSECLLVLLVALQLHNVLVLRSLEIFHLFQCQYTYVRGHSHIKYSHSLHQNDAQFQTHLPSPLPVKMPNLPKINVYNFRYKTSVVILMKLFFLSQKCINK